MKYYKLISLLFACTFALVGSVFLLMSDGVLQFFNDLSPFFGLSVSPLNGRGFFLALACGYMYLVTLLAFLMYKHAKEPVYAGLLANAKLASSFFSLLLFFLAGKHLVFLANFVVDGVIGIAVLYFWRALRREKS